MSEYPHPGSHPDADSLNAFIEGVLPEHERVGCLAHLADCPRCREIVYLAQEAVTPAPVPSDAVPFWKRWLPPIPVLAAAGVVCVLLVSISVYRLIRSERVEPVLTAVATPAIEPPAPLSEPVQKLPVRGPAKSITTRQPAPPATTVFTAPLAAPVSPAVPAPPAPKAAPEIVMAGIAGTVTDPAGAVLAGAVVTARPVAGASSTDTRTDSKGQYSFAGLPPGPYELQFLSPGFKQAKQQIDLQPQLVARADSSLEIGAAAETVTVNSEASLLKTESGELSHTVVVNGVASLPVLSGNSRIPVVSESPGKLPPSITASKDKLMLKSDSAGALFFSRNGGKSWKVVKPGWTGKVVRVESAHDPGAVFQLTTDSGSVWLSRDGTHWNLAPAPR